MIDDENKIYAFLKNYINSVIDIDQENIKDYFLKKKEIFISGKKYEVNCWLEDISEGKLFVVEVERDALVGSKVYSMGLLIRKDKRVVIDQEKMWDLGL